MLAEVCDPRPALGAEVELVETWRPSAVAAGHPDQAGAATSLVWPMVSVPAADFWIPSGLKTRTLSNKHLCR